MSVTIEEQRRRGLGDDGTVLYPDCGGGYRNPHVLTVILIEMHALLYRPQAVLLYDN